MGGDGAVADGDRGVSSFDSGARAPILVFAWSESKITPSDDVGGR